MSAPKRAKSSSAGHDPASGEGPADQQDERLSSGMTYGAQLFMLPGHSKDGGGDAG
jgi:hypothetical protein